MEKKKSESNECMECVEALSGVDNACVVSAVEALSAKRGKGITVMDLRGLEQAVGDYFVVCHAASTSQIQALAEEVEYRVDEACGDRPWSSSGRENAQWIVIDYFDVVIHIFQTEMRSFYDLDSLWADARIVYVEEDD